LFLFVKAFRLLVHEVVAVLAVDLEIVRCDLGAEMAVDAVFIDIEGTGDVVGPRAGIVGHRMKRGLGL